MHKFPVSSFSFLNTWAVCPHQAARKYIVKDLPREPETPEQAWGNEVHSAFENRLRSKQPLPANMPWEHFAAPLDRAGAAPEVKIGVTAAGMPCDFFAKTVWLRGKLDAPVVHETAALIPDFKTGKVREDPYELEVGAVLLQAKYPHVRVIKGRYIWLKENRLGEEHDLSDTARTWRRIQRTMDEVRGAIAAKEFEKRRGPLCGFCPVRDCEHNRRKN